MYIRSIIVVCAALLLANVGTAHAHQRCGKDGWGHGGRYWQLYDSNAQVTVAGDIQAITRLVPMPGLGAGMQMKLKTAEGPMVVHLGPAWYLDNQEPLLKVGDKVEVVGSRVVLQGRPALIAAEVRKEGQVLKLRDANGQPLWCGWRRP
jgi:hypothetical protein